MTKLEQLTKQLTAAQANLTRLEGELDASQERLLDDPNRQGAAEEVVRLKAQMEAATAGVNKAQAAVKAEQERITSPEAKKELKELDRLNAKITKLYKDIENTVNDLAGLFDEIESTHNQAKRIANRYGATATDWGGLVRLRGDVMRYAHAKYMIERRREIMKDPNHGIKPTMSEAERKEYLKKFYPKENERNNFRR
jgi:SMC interacting uncharacterized protein involved in chromosome segregation